MQKKIPKLLFVIHHLSNAGIERVCLNLLKTIDLKEFSIAVFFYSYTDKNLLINNLPAGINYYKYNYTGNKFSRFIKISNNLKRVIKDENADIVISFITYTNIIVNLIQRKLNFRHFATQHCILTGDIKNMNKLRGLFYLIASKIFQKKFDYNIVVSNSIKDDLVNNFSVLPQKIDVIYNSIIYNEINEKKEEELKIEYKSYILFVGRLDVEKSVDTLISAYSLIKNSHPNVHLIIIGEGSLKSTLEKQATELGVINTTIFLGFQSNPFKYMKNAVCLVLPSVFEGFGCVILEAMACKTPVIATNIDGPKEIITNGNNGLLFTPRNHIELYERLKLILSDKLLRKHLINNGYLTVKNFTSTNKEYEHIFYSVVHN